MQINLDLRDKQKEQRGEPIERLMDLQVVPGDPSKVMKLGSKIDRSVLVELEALLMSLADVFDWSHGDMPRTTRDIIEHHLNVDLKAKPVRQKRRFFNPERNAAFAKKMDKLLKAGFIREVDYPK